jgi:ribosomal protein S18 acetylase RimI-like enzyme
VILLLDTNVLIPAEPTSSDDVEPNTSAIAELLRAVGQGGHRVFVHSASVRELLADSNVSRAAMRRLLLKKYTELPQPPPLSDRLVAELTLPKSGSNHEVDLLLLSAVEASAVDHLVTEDDGIHRRARRVGLGDRVVTVADALVMVRALFPTIPEPPPLVSPVPAYKLDERDPIFASFRFDYPTFDDWLIKCKREHRQAWTVEVAGRYAGICIVKDEIPNEYGFPGKTLKICSLKIADQFRGYRYGELMLKTIFAYSVQNSYRGIFVEVFGKHQVLVDLLRDFGFEDAGESAKSERVLYKELIPEPEATRELAPLEFNIKYGPHAITLVGARAFIVPIQPRYHRLLFPELERQLQLATESHPFGNSIRKAYLSHSPIRKVSPGDLLLFYRSVSNQGVMSIGVAEGSLVSPDPAAITRFVGKRTVYSYAEIQRMAGRDVLAMLFRQARGLNEPWGLDLLKRAGIIRRAPQSFAEIPAEAVNWIASQLNVPR